jgi:hypothetical protein
MTSKRKRPRKAAKPKRVRAPSRRQKPGKHSYEYDQDGERGAERRARETAKRAERERLQRADERARSRAALDSFRQEQRREHEWINFADIADWFARRDNPAVPNEAARSGAYYLLRDDLLAGDFEEDGKSQVRFLHPNHQTEWISRQRMVDLELEKAVSLSDAIGTFPPEDVIAHYLAHCWIPHRMFERKTWLANARTFRGGEAVCRRHQLANERPVTVTHISSKCPAARPVAGQDGEDQKSDEGRHSKRSPYCRRPTQNV